MKVPMCEFGDLVMTSSPLFLMRKFPFDSSEYGMRELPIRWWIAGGLIMCLAWCAHGQEFGWKEGGPGVAWVSVTSPGPNLYTVVRVERSFLQKDLLLTTT